MTKQTTALTARADEQTAAPAVPAQPIGAGLMLNEALFERAKFVAKYMAEAAGFTPQHLVGKPQACFAVVNLALNWRLEPYMVARCTYQTPGGGIGFEGKLVQAIIEASGRIVGGVKYAYYGDWTLIQGKFAKKTSEKGREYAVPAWDAKHEIGLGVEVSAQLRGEGEPRTLRFDLLQAFPRNSTLWATDPKRQICYTAVRAFGNLTTPHLLMGVPFDVDDVLDASERARDVTPPPTRDKTAVSYDLASEDGEILETFPDADSYVKHLSAELMSASRDHAALWEANETTINRLPAGTQATLDDVYQAREAQVAATEKESNGGAAKAEPQQAKPAPATNGGAQSSETSERVPASGAAETRTPPTSAASASVSSKDKDAEKAKPAAAKKIERSAEEWQTWRSEVEANFAGMKTLDQLEQYMDELREDLAASSKFTAGKISAAYSARREQLAA